jgi:hypothetical protein
MARKETYEQAFKRWDRIFDGINKGWPAESIYGREDEIERLRIEHRANKRGDISEKNFDNALKTLDCVSKIIPTKKYSEEDWHLKIDRWVICEFPGYGKMKVAAQVKSSEKGINEFLKTYIDKDRERAWQRLFKLGMVVVNCQMKPFEIRREFLYQVREIKKVNPRNS